MVWQDCTYTVEKNHFCPANRKLERGKKPLPYVWRRHQHQKPSWSAARGGLQRRSADGSACSTFRLPLRRVEQNQPWSRKEVAQPQWRGHGGGRPKEHACSARRVASGPGPARGSRMINKHWVTEETVLLHAGFCSPKWLLETCVFRALSVAR